MVKSLVFAWVAPCRVRPFAAKVKMVAPGRSDPPNTSNLLLSTLFPDDPKKMMRSTPAAVAARAKLAAAIRSCDSKSRSAPIE